MSVISTYQKTTVVITFYENGTAAISDPVGKVVQLDPHVHESVHVKYIHVAEWLVVVHTKCDEHLITCRTCDVAAAAFDVIFFWVYI